MARIVVIFCFLFACYQPAWSLMRVQTMVPMSFNQQQAQQELDSAWQTLMVRMLGVTNPDMPAPENIQPLVLSNGFEFSEDSLLDALNLPIPTQLWVVQFDQAEVLAYLRQQNQPFWPLVRPQTLLWVDLEGEVLSDSERSPLARSLRERAQFRGLQLALPLWDLEEQLALSALGAQSDISSLRQASERYDTDWVFQVSVSDADSRVLQWRSVMPGVQLDFQSRGETLEQALISGLDRLADEQSRRLMQVSFAQTQALVWDLFNVHSYAAFYDLMSYLEKHPAIDRVELLEVEQDRVRVILGPNTSEQQLREQFQIGRRVQSMETDSLVPSFRWVR